MLRTMISKCVPASPEDVVGVVADIGLLGSWLRRVDAVERLDGSRARVRHRIGRRANEFIVELDTHRGDTVSLRAIDAPFPFVAHVRAEPAGSGSRVTYTREVGADSRVTAVMFRLLGPVLRWATAGEMRAELEKVGELAGTPSK